MIRHCIPAVLAACAFVLSPAAFASTASAEASVSQVRFSLSDLDAGDGISPAYSFITNTGPVSEGLMASGSSLRVAGQYYNNPAAFGAVAAQTGTPGLSAAGGVIGSDGFSVWSVDTTPNRSHSVNAVVSAGVNNGFLYAPVFARLLMVLTPKTSVTVTASFVAIASLVCSEPDLAANQCASSAYAYGEFNEAYSLATGQAINGFTESAAVMVQASGNGSQILDSASFWITNPSSETAIVGLYLESGAYSALGGVSDVPEPASAVLLAAGLAAGCGPFALRSRRRHRAGEAG